MHSQKGVASIAIILIVIGILGAAGYYAFQKIPVISQSIPVLNVGNSFEASENVIPTIIDRWLTDVSWQKPSVSVYKFDLLGQSKTGISRKGTVVNTDLTRNPYPIDLDKNLALYSWVRNQPDRTPAPMEQIYSYSKVSNGQTKILVITSKIIDSLTKSSPPYTSQITIFQEN